MCLRKVYKTYCSYLIRLQDHIDKLDKNDLIDKKLHSVTLKQISICMKKLNMSYTDNNSDDPFIDIYDTISHIINNVGYVDIISSIILLTKVFDINNIYKIINHDILNDIFILNNLFLPLRCFIDEIKTGELMITYENANNIQKLIVINIPILHNNNITIEGYFKKDQKNIFYKSLQINYPKIYDKKRYILDNINISDKSFINKYIKDEIYDILVLPEISIIKKINVKYVAYNNLINTPFIELMDKFMKLYDNKEKVQLYWIIKLLLYGSKENIEIANILYGITKNDSEISKGIYDNLGYMYQLLIDDTYNSDIDKSMNNDDIIPDIKKDIILNNSLPDNIRKLILKKISELDTNNNDYNKQVMYINILNKFPWLSDEEDSFFSKLKGSEKDSRNFLDNFMKMINTLIYGHKEGKDKIRDNLGKWISNPSSAGCAISMCGPPGIGKTLFAKILGKVLDIPFIRINLGGQSSSELMLGFRYTYVSAEPGIIVRKMAEMGSARCIMFFDELDKACSRSNNNEIFNVLTHLLDPESNKSFQDKFFQGINFPMDKVLFIFSYNDNSKISKPLLDRMDEIHMKAYNTKDKILIAKNFIIGEMEKMLDFPKSLVVIDDDTIEYIINHYTNEPGVRELKRKIEKIFLKLNILRIYGRLKTHMKITKDDVNVFLGEELINIEKIYNDDLVGVINGLYATPLGRGGIIPIQIYSSHLGNKSKFTLQLTGRQRKVMRESVLSGFTAAIHMIKPDIRDNYIKNNPKGFHIHTPSASISKDGPSAGCAFATAFISRILNIKIKGNIGVTGEIDLTGKIRKIGGLEYKIRGAERAGIKIILIPSDNKEELAEFKKNNLDMFDDDFKVIMVDKLNDVLKHCLTNYDNKYFNY